MCEHDATEKQEGRGEMAKKGEKGGCDMLKKKRKEKKGKEKRKREVGHERVARVM